MIINRVVLSVFIIINLGQLCVAWPQDSVVAQQTICGNIDQTKMEGSNMVYQNQAFEVAMSFNTRGEGFITKDISVQIGDYRTLLCLVKRVK